MFSEKIAKRENNKLNDFFWSSDFGIFEEHSDRKAIELVEKTFRNVERWSGTSLKFL